jgi:hypothetical protein
MYYYYYYIIDLIKDDYVGIICRAHWEDEEMRIKFEMEIPKGRD